MNSPYRTFRILLAATLAAGLCFAAGCKKTIPSPWKEMGFPLRNGEVRPGTDPERLLVVYRKMARHQDLLREFRSALEKNGYEFEKDGKEHDPPGNTHALVFKKGAVRLILTVSGRADTNITVRRLDP